MQDDTPSTTMQAASEVTADPDLEAQEAAVDTLPPLRSSKASSVSSIRKVVVPTDDVVVPVDLNPADNLHHVQASDDLQEAILSLPPPPSYDVTVENLSIAVPPYRAYIPTPIPIPIPSIITDTFLKLGRQADTVPGPQDASDGLIVRNVNATVRRGEVMAIIGGSGSGKTTLLHAIAARLGNLPIAEGHVAIRPSNASSDSTVPKGGEGHFKGMSKVVGFVRQNDYLLPHLTGTWLCASDCASS